MLAQLPGPKITRCRHSVPPAAHPAVGDMSVHTGPRTQSGRSIEMAPGLNMLLSEDSTDAWSPVQLLCGWKEGRVCHESRSLHQLDGESCPSFLLYPTTNLSFELLPQFHCSDLNQIQFKVSLFFNKFSNE